MRKQFNKRFLSLLLILLLPLCFLEQITAQDYEDLKSKTDLNEKRSLNNQRKSDANEAAITVLKGENDKLNTTFLETDSRIISSEEKIFDLKEKTSENTDKIAAADEKIENIQVGAGLNINHLNRFWMLFAGMLVFFMQAGFKVFEVGLVRKIDGNSVGIKNLIDWILVSISFLLVGFAFMFGESQYGFIGASLFGLSGIESVENDFGFEFFLFQLAFAATAATIVSGALAVRIRLVSYMILTLLIGAFIYPIFAHWVWGDLFVANEKPFLASLGFIDFAGSTVVHSVGAWIALTGMWFIRPRFGKVKKGKKVEIIVSKEEENKFKPHNLGYSVLGVLILWLGWWGFNGGSTSFILADADDNYTNTMVPYILINTNMAAVTGGLGAFLYSFWFQQKKGLYEKTLGGVLGGLVAITACCHVVSLPVALIIGALAGVIHNIVYDRLNEKTLFGRIIDDPVGAIPVHGACGILGTLAVAFGEKDKLVSALGLADGESWSMAHQFGIQLLGVAVCAVFTILISIVFFYILSMTIGLEVSEEQERVGKNY